MLSLLTSTILRAVWLVITILFELVGNIQFVVNSALARQGKVTLVPSYTFRVDGGRSRKGLLGLGGLSMRERERERERWINQRWMDGLKDEYPGILY